MNIIDNILAEIDDIQFDIIRDERKIRDLEAEELNADNVLEVIDSVSKALQIVDDKEDRQRLVRGIVKEIQVKDKHIASIELIIGKSIDVLGLDETS